MSDKKYSLTLAGANQLSPVFKSAAKDSGELTGKLRQQEQELRKLNRTQKDLTAYAGQRRELNAMSKEMAAANRKVSALAEGINASGVVTRKQQREFQKAKKEAEKLAAAHAKLRTTSQRLGSELKSSGVDLSRMVREEERLATAAGKASRQLDKQRNSVKQLAKAQKNLDDANARVGDLRGRVVGTAMSAGALAIPVSRGVARQSSMADVAKVVDFDGAGDRKQFRTGLERLGVQSGMGFGGAAEIAAAAGQSNIAKDEILSFTASASKMAVAFDMEARAAGETMSAWRAAMGLSQESTEQLADAVNHVSNNMNAKAADISGVLKRQGSVAMASGLSAEQSASLAGALLSGGATQEVASTTMKNLLGALTKGGAASKGQQEALSSLGFDAESLAGDMQSDAVGTITDVFAAIADAPIEEQSALVSELFGEESKGGIMPLLKNLPELQRAFGLTANATKFAGSMQDEYSSRLNTAEHKLAKAGQAFDRLLMVVGGSLLPVIEPAAEFAADFAMGLADFASQNETFTSALTMGAAALVTYKVASLGLMYARAKLNQVQMRGQLSQAKLAATENQTAAAANRAAISLSRLNGVLGATAAGGAVGGRGGKAGRGDKLGKMGRLGGPVGTMMAAGLTLAPLMSGGYGSGEETGSAIGGAAGGLGGWAAGAAGGAALGSVVPVVGTAIGGLIGGLAGGYFGGELGDWIGGGVGSLFDDDVLPAPGENAIAAAPSEVRFESNINLEKAPAHINEDQVAQLVVDKQKAQILPMLGGPGLSIEDSLEVGG